MNWKTDKPLFGSQIRVNRGLYYHHGIYIDDLNVVHFGSLTGELDPSKAMVIKTTLDEFLNDGVLEIASYSTEEEKKKFSSSKVVNIALSRLGEKGYDLFSNNCEHFSNECTFGEKTSNQVSNVLEMLSSLF